ncbi:YcaO-like family protein [Pedobacter sp. WC2501]|uniref:YcaO-like family protein n=1 Tax=Pedobacter sp. WC2501 TaxID=3461400 RepID=UPI004045A255
MISSLYGHFGFINKPLMSVPSNIYMPKNLFERVITTNNLLIVGNNKKDISGGGISFNLKEAEISAFGEYVERYSSSFQSNENLIFGSFNELSKIYNCYSPKQIHYFSEKQYSNPNFKLRKLDGETEIHWIWCTNYITSERILMPFFMANVENVSTDGKFHINTTTGTACHISTDKVIESGLMECIERDAFCKFWYLQKIKKFRKFSSEFVIDKFRGDKRIQQLFDNKKIRIVTFDISEFAYCPTFVTFISFKKRNRVYQSIGSATRLIHKEALIKSCIEAYQGIEYIELVCKQNTYAADDIENLNFQTVDSFRRHYALYNVHPELVDKSTLLKGIFTQDGFCHEWQDFYPHHLKNISQDELNEKNLNEVYFADLTTKDVKQFGLEVVKVITPKLHLLTGNYNYPYLGLFEEGLDLMTEMPHPFP